MPEVKITLNLSKEREQAYLAVMRKRFNAPRRGWSWLIRALIRELCAQEEEEKYPHLPTQLFLKDVPYE